MRAFRHKSTKKRRGNKWYLIVAALAMALIAGGIFFRNDLPTGSNTSKSDDNPSASQQSVKGWRLLIPGIGVEAPIVSVGQKDNGNMADPANGHDVGWYNKGTMPGQQGNAVLAGHVDWEGDPAVFARLGELTPGQTIEIVEKDGRRLIFTVTDMKEFDPADAPLAEIFGGAPDERLNLITCSGAWDNQANTYKKRLVVFTRLTQES